MKMNNEMIYNAIKVSIIDDMNIVYEVFKEEGIENLEGVIIYLNSLRGLGNYLKNNPIKLAEFVDHLLSHLDFRIQISFGEKDEDEYFPLICNEK